MLTPAAKPTAKYAHEGELFARMDLTSEVSEDTSHGRLILQNAHTVLIAPAAADTADKSPDNNLPDKVLCGWMLYSVERSDIALKFLSLHIFTIPLVTLKQLHLHKATGMPAARWNF